MRSALLGLIGASALAYEGPTGLYCGHAIGEHESNATDVSATYIHLTSTSHLHLHLAIAPLDASSKPRHLSCDHIPYTFDGTLVRLKPDDPSCLGADSAQLELRHATANNSMRLTLLGRTAVLTQQACHSARASAAAPHKLTWPWPIGKVIQLPQLNIDPTAVITAGCSHAGDFASQVHIAYSSMVKGSCVFSGQPYHCAVKRFARDYLQPQGPATGVPNCDGCPSDMTLLYDHCKNHPQYVDVGELVDYPRRACGQNPIVLDECIDDVKHLYDARAYVFRPTHDRCYLPGAVENTADLYALLMTDPAAQLKLVNDQPFPHVLPKNTTPYFNHSTPAGFDGPGECLRWVYGEQFGFEPLAWATAARLSSLYTFNQSEFVDDWGVGLQDTAEVYIPKQCEPGAAGPPCKLIFMLGVDLDFARYAESNGIVIVGMAIGGHVDRTRFPNACEVQRGLSDVYGQLSDDYAMQSGYQMRVVGKILRRLLGLDGAR